MDHFLICTSYVKGERYLEHMNYAKEFEMISFQSHFWIVRIPCGRLDKIRLIVHEGNARGQRVKRGQVFREIDSTETDDLFYYVRRSLTATQTEVDDLTRHWQTWKYTDKEYIHENTTMDICWASIRRKYDN